MKRKWKTYAKNINIAKDRLSNIEFMKNYPYTVKCLYTSKGDMKPLLRVLLALYDCQLTFFNDSGKGKDSYYYSCIRGGFEVFTSVGYLAEIIRKEYAKNTPDKGTTSRKLREACVLGFIVMFKPRLDKFDEQYNTQSENLAANLIRLKNEKDIKNFEAVRYYRIEKLTKKKLKTIEKTAKKYKPYGTNIGNKDIVRDVEGEKHANSVFDSGYDIHPQTNIRRLELAFTLLQTLSVYGFAYSRDIVKACSHENDRHWIEKTWREYKPTLLQENGLTERRPTKEEKERFSLSSLEWIIVSDRRTV